MTQGFENCIQPLTFIIPQAKALGLIMGIRQILCAITKTLCDNLYHFLPDNSKLLCIILQSTSFHLLQRLKIIFLLPNGYIISVNSWKSTALENTCIRIINKSKILN